MKYFLSLILLIIPAFLVLLKPGYYTMHDDMQLIRQLEMDKCFSDGQLPCRWAPDLGYAYGYPLFNFYPPLPYYLGHIIRQFDFSYIDTVKILGILQIILSATTMFFLGKTLLGDQGGFISGLVYTYAPYRFNNIYIRGAFNEAWASVFFPLVILFIYRQIQKPSFSNTILLSMSMAGVLLSHNPMALLFFPLAGFVGIFWLVKKFSFKTILYLIFSGVLALGLTSFFTLPVIFESKLVQIETMFSNYYSFDAHFTSIKQLFFSNFWGDGPSHFGPQDGMSFSIGYIHWMLPLIGSVSSLLLVIKKRKFDHLSQTILISCFIGFICLFLSHERSAFFWSHIKIIQKIQFPWRWLNLATFFLSISTSSSLIRLSKTKFFKPSVFFILTSVILVNYYYASPLRWGPLTDEQKFSGQSWTNQITSGIYDYLPKTARIAAQKPSGGGIDQTIPPETLKNFTHRQGTDWDLINLNLSSASTVYLSRLDFPTTNVYDNGKPISHTAEPELGRISVDLTSGYHQLYIKLTNTPIREYGNLLSLFSVLLILLGVLWKPYLRQIRAK